MLIFGHTFHFINDHRLTLIISLRLNNGYRQGILSVLTCCCSTSSMVAHSTDPEQNRTTILQRSLSRSYSSGFHPTSSNLNYINNLNNSNSSNSSNHHHHHHSHSPQRVNGNGKSSDKEINLTRLKSNLLSVPSFSNGAASAGAGADQGTKNGDANNNNNNSHTSNTTNSTSSGGSVGTGSGSRHLQIIYISLKEKYSKDEDAEDTQEEGENHPETNHESNKSKSETHFKRNKKPSATRIATAEQRTNSEGEYFELMETIQQENGLDHNLEDVHEDTGLKFKLG